MHKLPSAGQAASGPWAAFWAAVFNAHAELTGKEATSEGREFEIEAPAEK